MRTPVPRRILCVIETIGLGGGAEQLLGDLLPRMRALGADIEIAALFDWPETLADELAARGVLVHQLRLGHRWSVPRNLWALWRVARDGGFTLFWGHLYFGNFYARLVAALIPGARAVITLHSEGYLQVPPKTARARLNILIERLVMGSATVKVAVSRAVSMDYGAFFGWHDIAVIHNGIAFEKFPPPPDAEERGRIRAGLGAGQGEMLLVTPGRFIPKKGHLALLGALAILRDEHGWQPRAAFFGEATPYLAVLEARARELALGPGVRFHGSIRQGEMFAIIQSCDIVCIPSLREPFGIAAAEALALGAPTILSAVDGLLEVEGGAGAARMVPPGDARALADALLELRDAPELRARIAARGRARVTEMFDIAVVAGAWVRLLEAV